MNAANYKNDDACTYDGMAMTVAHRSMQPGEKNRRGEPTPGTHQIEAPTRFS